MRACVLLGLAAAVALPTLSTLAQEQTLEAIPFTGEVRVAAPESLVGGTSGIAIRSFGTRGIPGAVFDNTGSAGLFWYGYLNAPHYGDDVSLVPGRQSGIQPQLLSDMDVIISVQDGFGVGRTFDMAVSFWDTIDPTTVAPYQAYSDPLGGFTASIALPGGAWTIPIDLSGLPGGGIQLTDGGFCVDIAFYEVGTSTYLPVGDAAACMMKSSGDYATAGLPAGMNGFGMRWFWFDSGLDGTCSNSERYNSGVQSYASLANLAYALYGDVRCAADFNDDGFVDPLDYNQFINAFEAGGCP